MHVAVTPHRHLPGVYPPGFKDQTYDWRHAPGSPDNTRRVVSGYRRAPLADALAATYDTDAHLVTYQVIAPDGRSLSHQPRICKTATDWLDVEGFRVELDTIACDVDNPGHAPWSPPLRQAFDALWSAPPAVLETVGVHFTRHGFHLFQALDEPLAADVVERTLRAWLRELAAALEASGGPWLEPDPACKDWTRHFRLPHVRRAGADYRSPLVDLARMSPRAIEPDPLPKAPPGVTDAGAPVSHTSP